MEPNEARNPLEPNETRIPPEPEETPESDAEPAAQSLEPQPPVSHGCYAGAGTGRVEYTTGYTANGYTAGGQSASGGFEPFPNPGTRARKAAKSKSRKFPGRLLGTVAACLVCALLGGMMGSGFAARRMEQSVADLQAQVDALRAGSGSASVPVTPIAHTTGKSAAQVYQENVNTVVYIESVSTANYYGQPVKAVSSGSGFLISADGYILSNYHVVENTYQLTVKTYSGESYDAKLVGYDASSDVAVLKIEGENLPYVTIGDSDQVNVGDQVVVIGNPLGELTSSLTGGYVSAKDRTISTDNTLTNMIQTDAAINSGNSGGPLFNMNGQVIGITSAKYSGSSSSGASIEGIGFAIPINDVMNMVEDLKQYGYLTGQAYMGVSVTEIDAQTVQMYGLPTGVFVNSVESGSCAEKAGIQKGDIITALNGTTITSYDDLVAALKKFGAGDTTQVSIWRQGQQKNLSITFDEKNAAPQTTQPTAAQEDSNSSSGQQGSSSSGQQQPNQSGSWPWNEFFAPFFGR